MKQVVRLALIAFVAGILAAVDPVAAKSPSATYTISNITCQSVMVSGNVQTKQPGPIGVFIKDLTTGTQIANTALSVNGSGNFSGTVSFPLAVGDALRVHVVFNGGDKFFTDPACVPTVTWCDLSGDGRIDGLCGDRIAVYCNTDDTPPNLEIWGVGNDSLGFELATYDFSDLEKAPKGLSTDLGRLGVVSASVDAANNFWVAWNGQIAPASGGPFFATGQVGQGYAKGFKCDYTR